MSNHGVQVRVLIDGTQTGGRVALIEARAMKGVALPRHIHHQEDVVVYVAEGEILCHRGNTPLRASAGACVPLPAGIEHGLSVISRKARLLALVTPAGLEGIASHLASSEDPPMIERIITLAAHYGIEITGPTVNEGAQTR